jgi:hypothetical protein
MYDAAAELIRALGAAVGIPDLALDAAGACALRIDAIPMRIEHEPEADRLLLVATLGAPPAGEKEALYARLLEANLAWKDTAGATIALDPRGARILLLRPVPLGLPPAAFPDLVERFVDVAEAWSGVLGDLPPAVLPEALPEPAGSFIDPARFA